MNSIREKIINDFLGHGEFIEIPCSSKYINNQPIYVYKDSGLVRAKITKTSKEISEILSNEIFGDKITETTYTAKNPAVVARQNYVTEFAKQNIDFTNKSVCDIGAGEGEFLKIFKRECPNTKISGIEPSIKNCEILSGNSIRNYCGTLEEYRDSNEFKERSYDVIFMMWTLVNSHSCLRMVEIAKEMLKPGGYLVLAEGSRINVPFKKPLSLYFSKLNVELHPWHFSKNSLQNLLKVNGFSISSVNRYIDTDYLCVIGKKKHVDTDTKEIDDYNAILGFFQRWDLESFYYL